MKKLTMGLLLGSGICIIGGGILTVAGLASGGRPGIQITSEGILTGEDIEKTAEGKKVFSNVRNLCVDTESMEIRICRGEKFEASYRVREKSYHAKLTEDGDTANISVQYCMDEHFVTALMMDDGYGRGELVVTIPEKQKLEQILLKGTDSVVILEDIAAAKVRAETENNDITCTRVQADAIEIENGYETYLTLQKVQGGSFCTKSESVTMNVDDCTFSEWKTEAEDNYIKSRDTKAEKLELTGKYGELQFSGLDCPQIMVRADDGTVQMQLADALANYHLKLQSEYGGIVLDGEEIESNSDGEEAPLYLVDKNPDAKKQLEIHATNIEINVSGKN